MKPLFQIAGITVKELLHEKIFYLLGAFSLLAIALSLLLGDLTYAEQSKITIDFLLAGIELTNLLFSVFMGITLLHRELNLGWIAMVLSKPISRTHFLLGKFLGQITIQASVILFLGVLTVVMCRMNEIDLAYQSLVQSLVLTFLQGILMSAIVYFFAVNMGALVSAAASLGLFALGSFTEGAVKTNAALESHPAWKMVKAVVPNFRLFNMKTLVSYGLSIEWHLLGIVCAYTVVCTLMYLLLAGICFSKRDIFT